MTSADIEQVSKIIVDMLIEFQNEKNRIQILYDNNCSRISEIEDNIANYIDSEDVEFKVFSPRNISTINEDKLLSMDKEKVDLQESNKELNYQLKYYIEKIDKLRFIQSIISGQIIEEDNFEEEVDNEDNLDYDPIKELFGNNLKNNVSNNTSINEDNNIETEVVYEIDDINQFDKKSLIDDLERISHRIELSTKVIDTDLFRTKIEMKNVKNNLDSIIQGLK